MTTDLSECCSKAISAPHAAPTDLVAARARPHAVPTNLGRTALRIDEAAGTALPIKRVKAAAAAVASRPWRPLQGSRICHDGPPPTAASQDTQIRAPRRLSLSLAGTGKPASRNFNLNVVLCHFLRLPPTRPATRCTAYSCDRPCLSCPACSGSLLRVARHRLGS